MKTEEMEVLIGAAERYIPRVDITRGPDHRTPGYLSEIGGQANECGYRS